MKKGIGVRIVMYFTIVNRNKRNKQVIQQHTNFLQFLTDVTWLIV